MRNFLIGFCLSLLSGVSFGQGYGFDSIDAQGSWHITVKNGNSVLLNKTADLNKNSTENPRADLIFVTLDPAGTPGEVDATTVLGMQFYKVHYDAALSSNVTSKASGVLSGFGNGAYGSGSVRWIYSSASGAPALTSKKESGLASILSETGHACDMSFADICTDLPVGTYPTERAMFETVCQKGCGF